ncbi:MAG: WD40 repeat domain-containing protein [Gemmataceae bacterium]
MTHATLLLLAGLAAPPAGLPAGAVDRIGSPFLRHTSPVAAVAFSPDGKRLASGSNYGGIDPAVKVWDADTGAELWSARYESTGVAWFTDGTRVASAGRDGTVKAWELATGSEVFSSHTPGGWAHGVAVSPDGKRLASIHGNRRTVRLWDAATGALVRDLEPGAGKELPFGELAAVAFHPDGKSVAAGVPGAGLVFWDVATGKQGRTIPGVYTAHGWLEYRSITFAGRDARVVVCQPDGLGLFDPATGEQVKHTRGTRAEDPTRMSISSVAQSADGSTLALVRNHELKLWDLDADREVRSFGAMVAGPFALSPDGKRLARAVGYSIALWETATGRRLPADREIDGDVGVIGFGPTGEAYIRHATGVRVWDVGPAGRRRGERTRVPDGQVVALSPDGRTAVQGGYWYQGRPRLTDMATGNEKVRLDTTENEGVLHAAFHPDGRHLVAVDTGGRTLSLWDVTTGRRVRKFEGHEDPVDAIAIAPDGKRMVTSGSPRAYIRTPFKGYVGDPGMRVWDIDTGAQLPSIPGRAGTLAYSPDGTLLAAGDGNGTARLIDAATGKVARELTGPRLGPERMAFTPDGRTLVAVGREKAVRLWDVATGGERRVFAGHAGEVYGLAVAPDGRRVMTSGGDGLVYVWDVYAPDRPPPADLTAAVRGLADPDATAAFHAIRELVAAGDRAVPLISAVRPADAWAPRAVEVLERVGSPAARAALAQCAAGPPGQPLTVEARAALQRLGNG